MTFRYSQLNTAHSCLTKYKLVYLDKVPNPLPEASHFVFGTALHLALQAHFEDEDAINTFDVYWKSIDPAKYTWDRFSYEDHQKMGQELLRKWLKSHAKHFKALHVEKDIAFKVANFEMTGKVDWIGYYKDELTIMDWKTSFATYDKRKPLVDGQLWIYTHGVKQQLGLDIKQVGYQPFIKSDCRIQTPVMAKVTLDRMKFAIDNAIVMMHDLSTRKQWPRNEQSCLRCDYYTHCYKGEENGKE